MPSWLGKLEHEVVVIGGEAVKIATAAEPAVAAFNPAAGVALSGVLGFIHAGVALAEKTAASGPDKLAMVQTGFQGAMSLFEELTGKQFQYDPGLLTNLINSINTTLNIASDFKGTIKS